MMINNSDMDEEGFVTFKGQYYKIKNAKLYTPPSTNIPLISWLLQEKKQLKLLLDYTDGLITTSKPNKAKEIFDLFDKTAIEANKNHNNLQKIGKP